MRSFYCHDSFSLLLFGNTEKISKIRIEKNLAIFYCIREQGFL